MKKLGLKTFLSFFFFSCNTTLLYSVGVKHKHTHVYRVLQKKILPIINTNKNRTKQDRKYLLLNSIRNVVLKSLFQQFYMSLRGNVPERDLNIILQKYILSLKSSKRFGRINHEAFARLRTKRCGDCFVEERTTSFTGLIEGLKSTGRLRFKKRNLFFRSSTLVPSEMA